MDAHKLIRSGVAHDTGMLRLTLQHCLEAALSITDPKIEELMKQPAQVTSPRGFKLG